MKLPRRVLVLAPITSVLAMWVARAQTADDPLPSPDSATGIVGEQFGGWAYGAGVYEGTMFVHVSANTKDIQGLLAFDAANRAALAQVHGPTTITVVFRRPLSEGEVQDIAQATGASVMSYIARAVDDRGMRITIGGPGLPGVRAMPTLAVPLTRSSTTPSPTSSGAGFRGYVTVDVYADAGQIAALFADERVFTADVVRVIAVDRGRSALIAADPAVAVLPMRIDAATQVYWSLEDYGIAPT